MIHPKCMVHGMSEASKQCTWDKKYCFVPLDTPCAYCGSLSYAYGAYVKENVGLCVRYICRNCGANDDVKKVELIPAEQNSSRQKRWKALGIERG